MLPTDGAAVEGSSWKLLQGEVSHGGRLSSLAATVVPPLAVLAVATSVVAPAVAARAAFTAFTAFAAFTTFTAFTAFTARNAIAAIAAVVVAMALLRCVIVTLRLLRKTWPIEDLHGGSARLTWLDDYGRNLAAPTERTWCVRRRNGVSPASEENDRAEQRERAPTDHQVLLLLAGQRHAR